MAQNNLSRVDFKSNPLSRKVKVYDVQNKTLIAEFETINQAQIYTGVKCINRYIQNKTRSCTNKLNKVICFR